MLEETLHEKQIENDTSCSCKDESTMNNLTSILTSAILGNDEFHKAIQNIVTTIGGHKSVNPLITKLTFLLTR